RRRRRNGARARPRTPWVRTAACAPAEPAPSLTGGRRGGRSSRRSSAAVMRRRRGGGGSPHGAKRNAGTRGEVAPGFRCAPSGLRLLLCGGGGGVVGSPHEAKRNAGTRGEVAPGFRCAPSGLRLLRSIRATLAHRGDRARVLCGGGGGVAGSPHEAKRNAGLRAARPAPDFAALHPGYACWTG